MAYLWRNIDTLDRIQNSFTRKMYDVPRESIEPKPENWLHETVYNEILNKLIKYRYGTLIHIIVIRNSNLSSGQIMRTL